MAGIGFVLRKFFKKDNLSSVVLAYVHAVIATSGPWVFTVISLGSLYFFTSKMLYWAALDDFKVIILYNFSLSLVFTAPLTIVVTRYLSDSIYREDLSTTPGMLLGAWALLLVTGGIFATALYFGYANFSFNVALLAVANFLVISTVWLVNVFVSALRFYKGITFAFVAGLSAAVFLATEMSRSLGTAGMLFGYSTGLMVIVAILLALIFVEYPRSCKQPWAFLPYFKQHWQLALGGLFYSLAIWVDKWIMWLSPDGVHLSNNLYYYPYYDSAMFIATLTIIPSMAMFLLNQETSFFEQYFKFYRDICQHANFRKISENQQRIEECVSISGRNLLIVQVAVCIFSVLVAPYLFPYIGLNFIQMGIFRNGLLGATFQVMALFLMILLAYFENRKGLLFVQGFFFATNTLFTLVVMKLGFAFYGYGYFLSALLTFILSAILLERYLRKLPYHAFITTNSAVSEENA